MDFANARNAIKSFHNISVQFANGQVPAKMIGNWTP